MSISTKRQPVISRKARDFARREEEILSTALECFSGEDWESVTVARIADIVGIAKGTMYLHFSSKHDIYARLTLDFYRDLLKHLCGSRTGSGAARLSNLIRQSFLFYLNNPMYRCVTQYCEREDFRRRLNCELSHQFDAIDKAFYQLLHHELELGINAGAFKPLALDQQILGLKCTFHGALTVLWCNRNAEQQDPQKYISDITQYMLAPLLLCDVERHAAPSPENPPPLLAHSQTLEATTNE